MQYLTPYAYKFVEKQLNLRKQVVIVMHSCNSEVYEVKMEVMSTHIVTINQCCCRLWASINEIAFHTANGDDLCLLSFEEEQMRTHLLQCCEVQCLKPFPITSDKVVRCRGKKMLVNLNAN